MRLGALTASDLKVPFVAAKPAKDVGKSSSLVLLHVESGEDSYVPMVPK